MRKKQERQLGVADMRMLRFSVGVTTKDKIRAHTRGTLKLDKFRQTRLRWYGRGQD